MPAWLKLTFVVIALLVVAGVATCVVQIANFRHFPGDVQKATADGSAFGRGADKNACVNEALARSTRCSRLDQACVAKAQMFLMSCLNEAKEPDGFCASVPAAKPFSFTNRWPAEECARRGYKRDPRCQMVVTMVQAHCSATRR